MAEYKEAVRAGLFAGLLAGAFTAIADYLTSLVVNVAATSFTNYSQLVIFSLMGSDVVSGLLFGLVLGLIFAVIHKRYLTGRSLQIRAIILSFVLWPFSIILGFTNPVFGASFLPIKVAIELISAVILGNMLGYFYSKADTRDATLRGFKNS